MPLLLLLLQLLPTIMIIIMPMLDGDLLLPPRHIHDGLPGSILGEVMLQAAVVTIRLPVLVKAAVMHERRRLVLAVKLLRVTLVIMIMVMIIGLAAYSVDHEMHVL